MGGLLYKDFVSINGKKLVWILIMGTVLFFGLRAAFPGTMNQEAFLTMTEDGQEMNLLDYLFFSIFACCIIGILGLMNGWVAKIVDGDTKNKIRGYISSLPLEKNAYIASKYLFIAISAYVFLSFEMMWGVICNAFCREGVSSELMAAICSFIPPLICLVLLSAAIELPLFILLGVQKAKLVKIAVVMGIGFVVVGFLFFGDLNWLSENLSILVFMKWYETHTFEVAFLTILSPVITLALYYVSYRITCFFSNREV